MGIQYRFQSRRGGEPVSFIDRLGIRPLMEGFKEYYPDPEPITGPPADPEIVVGGKKLINFSSPNYLGLSNDKRSRAAFVSAVETYGVGTNGSGIMSGYTDEHRLAEADFAAFMGAESAVYFNSVSDATSGIMSSLVRLSLRTYVPTIDAGDVAVFCDHDNHSSLHRAVRETQPDKVYVYRSCDAGALERWLAKSRHRRKVIVTDGYFSMSARIAPLPAISQLADQYGAVVVVDDAHATGVLGHGGRGTMEHYRLTSDMFVVAHSAGKGLGIRGGWVAGTCDYCLYLRFSAESYMFSGTLPASIPAAVRCNLATMISEPWRRERVMILAERMRSHLKAEGQLVMGEGHIVPWRIGNDAKAVRVYRGLVDWGVYAKPVVYPAVRRGEDLVRFMPMATHTDEQVDRACEAISAVVRSG